MPRPRSASAPARPANDDWASPGSWGGRKSGEAQDKRSDRGQLSPFGTPSFSPPVSRTINALDLATSRTSPKHAASPFKGTLPSLSDVSKAMKAGGNQHALDSHALAKALGGGTKLAGQIEKRMQAHRDRQEALMNQFTSKGFGELHKMPGQVMKDVNRQLSEFKPKKQSLFGALKSKK